jgi:hypothetical protein
MPYLRGLAIAAALLPAAVVPLRAQTDAPVVVEPAAVRPAPPPVGGLWCGAGLLGGFTLEIAQQSQDFEAKLIRNGKVREITGHLEGATLHTDPQRDQTMELLARGNELRITDATGKLALARGQFFTRAVDGSCTN